MKKDIIDFLKRAMPFGIGCVASALFAWLISNINEELGWAVFMVSVVTGLYFIVYLLFFIIPMIFGLCTEFIGKMLGIISRKRNQLDKTDFEKNKQYYREILKESSPLIVGYMDNLELDTNKIIAELLYLKMEKIIDINNGRLEKIENYEKFDLKFSELEILSKIKVGKLVITKFKEYLPGFRNMVAREAGRLELIKEVEPKKESKIMSKIIMIIFLVVSFILGLGISIFIEGLGGSTVPDIKVIVFCMFVFWPVSMLVLMIPISAFLYGYDKSRGKLYKRTAKGRELNQKLEGLKNYLKDYSLMDEREAKEIELWDDYLIYSVMFGQNKKIIEEYEKYIEIIE